MSKFFVCIYTLICVGFTSAGNAATDNNGGSDQPCDNSITILVGNSLGVSDFPYAANACKRWPKDKSIAIAAYAYDSGVEYEKSLIVALIDINKNRVIATYKGKIQEDSVSTVGEPKD